MPDVEPVISDDGFEISSNTETPAEMREILAKPKVAEAPEGEVESGEIDQQGRTRGSDGKFRARPIPDKPTEKTAPEPEKAAKPEEGKPEEEKPVAEEKPEPEEEKSRRERRSAEGRVREATAKAAEARRLLEEERRRNEDIAARLERLERGEKPRAEPERPPRGFDPQDPKPRIEEFADNPVGFVESLTDWKVRAERRAIEAEHAQRQQVERFQRAVDERVGKFLEKIEETRKADPAVFGRIAPEIEGLTPSFLLPAGERPTALNAIADEILASDDAPRLMAHLSEHPDVFQRLATLPPRELVRQMARIEASLAGATTGPPPQAPPYIPTAQAGPTRPVVGAPTATDADLDPDTVTLDDWVKHYNARDRKRVSQR